MDCNIFYLHLPSRQEYLIADMDVQICIITIMNARMNARGWGVLGHLRGFFSRRIFHRRWGVHQKLCNLRITVARNYSGAHAAGVHTKLRCLAGVYVST